LYGSGRNISALTRLLRPSMLALRAIRYIQVVN